MKQFLLFLALFTSLYADAKLYVGANTGYQYEVFTVDATTAYNNAKNFNLKFGYGDMKAYAIEFSIDYTPNESNIVSQNDGDKYGFNIELLKSFDFDLFFTPFVKVGFGSGLMKVERSTKTQVNYGSFNAGIGTFIPLDEHFDLEIAYLFKQLSYEKFNLIDQIQEPSARQQNAYAGINFRF